MHSTNLQIPKIILTLSNFRENASDETNEIQSNFDLVTVNLVTILDLVTFFRKTDFLCSKNNRYSDILENSKTLI